MTFLIFKTENFYNAASTIKAKTEIVLVEATYVFLVYVKQSIIDSVHKIVSTILLQHPRVDKQSQRRRTLPFGSR